MSELQNFKALNNNKILVVLPINKVEDYFLNECLYSIAQQEQPVDLVILTNGLDDNSIKAIENIAASPKIILHKKNEKDEIIQEEKYATGKINFQIISTEADTFPKVFNHAFNIALKNKYEWFSVVEQDDVVANTWYKNLLIYANTKPEIDGFLPLTKEISNSGFIGFFNEAPWVEGFAEESGKMDLNLLLRYNCANLTGVAFKTESIKSQSMHIEDIDYYKPIKEDFKISYIHEFYLRMVYNDLKFFSIPRIGYEHRIDRPTVAVNYFTSKLPKDLLSKSKENGGVTMDEYTYWNDLAKKEYYYNTPKRIMEYKEKIPA